MVSPIPDARSAIAFDGFYTYHTQVSTRDQCVSNQRQTIQSLRFRPVIFAC